MQRNKLVSDVAFEKNLNQTRNEDLQRKDQTITQKDDAINLLNTHISISKGEHDATKDKVTAVVKDAET